MDTATTIKIRFSVPITLTAGTSMLRVAYNAALTPDLNYQYVTGSDESLSFKKLDTSGAPTGNNLTSITYADSGFPASQNGIAAIIPLSQVCGATCTAGTMYGIQIEGLKNPNNDFVKSNFAHQMSITNSDGSTALVLTNTAFPRKYTPWDYTKSGSALTSVAVTRSVSDVFNTGSSYSFAFTTVTDVSGTVKYLYITLPVGLVKTSVGTVKLDTNTVIAGNIKLGSAVTTGIRMFSEKYEFDTSTSYIRYVEIELSATLTAGVHTLTFETGPFNAAYGLFTTTNYEAPNDKI
jgi:hypothetical protein